MKKLNIALSFLMLAFIFGACKNTQKKDPESKKEITQKTEQRIISLNGAITEIVCALGHGNELVGRDVTSTYPEWVKDSIKDLGHVRSLNIESVLALNPTIILASDRDMNPDLKKMISESGIKFKIFNQKFSVQGTKDLIKAVADVIENKNTQPLLDKIDEDLTKVQVFEKKPKVLFVYARGAGTMMVAGEGTPMEKVIELAGGANAVDGFENFKPLTTESLLNSDPDVILLFDSGMESLGGMEGWLKVPGVAQTKAGKNKAIITMDGALISGFGPRVGEAAYKLNQLLAPYAK